MEPFVVWLDGRFDAELGRCFCETVPYVEQVLPLIFRRVSFDQADMRPNFESIVSEVNELAELVRRVRLVRSEYRDDGVRPDAVERVRVARDDAFERVVLEDAFFELLLGL